MKKNVRLSSLLVFSAVFLVSCGSTPAKSSSSQSNTASTQSTSSNSDSSSSEEKVAFTKKAVNLYTTPTSHVNVSLYFTDKNPDIPFIDFAEFNKEVEMTYASSLDEVSGVLTIHNGDYVSSIDFKKGLYYVEDFEHFFAQGSKVSFLDTMAMTAPDANGKYHYLKRDDSSVFLTSGRPISIDLSAYDIPLYAQEGKAYLPLATYSDLFVSPLGAYIVYNTKDAFVTGELDAFKDMYYSDDLKKQRSQSLAEFTYHEFCLNMDNGYGLKESHGITNFDDYISRCGLKEDMLSTDPSVSSIALSRFILGYLDDSHSGSRYSSPLAGFIDLVKQEYYGPSMKSRNIKAKPYSKARYAVYGDAIKPYEVVGGDTAIITFDEFALNKADYYKTFPTEADAASDTIALVSYCNSKIQADSAIKNVVIDLSLNGGGAADSAAFMASWICGGVTINTMNPFDGAKASITYYGDTNLDGVFDSNDYLTGKKVYCLTTESSFSCGNLLPSIFKATGAATLLGRTSGGGACIVGKAALPDGSTYQLSSREVLCTRKNGSFYNIDQGMAPDYVLDDPTAFYDRTALREKIVSLS
jgi:hypothetical protein